MQPSDVRRTIFAEHAQLRRLLDEVGELVRRVEGGDAEAAPALRERGRALHDFFCRHLALEDAILVPALRTADGWGEERARLVSQEHAEQREVMEYVLQHLCEPDRPCELVARVLASLCERLTEDMVHEEKAVLDERVLRDDPIGIDVETG